MSTSAPSIPKGITREVQADRVVLERRWRSNELWFILPFTLFWDGFLVLWYILALGKPDTPWLMIVFPLFHVAIGLGLTYFCVALFLNCTRMEISPDSLVIRTDPVPWHKEIRLVPAEITEIFSREQASRGYASTYDVIAMTTAGEERRLFPNLNRYDLAAFYVREIRSLLGLTGTAPSARRTAG